ncbi:MAG TPA: 3'-5' exonuclease [Steroidobacteraceae bacterium]|nr:3'-5' exonuclease [Steroidobacteraceae bacterium]
MTPDFTNLSVKVFDTECTGLDDPGVVEYAYVEIDPSAVVSGFFLLESPKYENFPGDGGMRNSVKPMTLGALATHHILPEEYEDQPIFNFDRDVGNESVIIGHNIDFDWKASNCPPTPRICTLAMARRIWPDLDSHTLAALTYHIHGANELTRNCLKQAHRATADVMLTMDLLFHLLAQRPELNSWAKVWEFSEDARLPRRWSFGKFGPNGKANPNNPVGRPLHDADSGYLKWVRGNCTDRDDWEYLEKALDKMQAGELAP